MKVPLSVRDLYEVLSPRYSSLKEAVDSRITASKNPRWHYESRIKSAESFALKLETGRVPDPAAPDDLFACTIVVENLARVSDAEAFVLESFTLSERRPRDFAVTHLAPHSFDFDDVRLYVTWKDSPSQRPSNTSELVFEIQIKTFLQHAWGIATHDFIYKTDAVDWPSSRIAYQVKAMLENAELSIAEARRLTESELLKRSDKHHTNLQSTITNITSRWDASLLPTDLKRLAQSIDDLCRSCKLAHNELWAALDRASGSGHGVKSLNLSPYGAVLHALLAAKGPSLLDPLGAPHFKHALFVPLEIDLPPLSPAVISRIIRPPHIGQLH